MADVIGGIEATLSANDAGLEAGFAKARQAMAAIEAKIAQLTAEEKKGAIATADYAAQVAQLESAHARLVTAMAAAAGRTNALNTAMAGISTGAKFNAQSMMFLGQAVDDIQYGFSAIVNQVPQVLMSLGVGAGLAGAASIAAVAANQLSQRWGDLQDMLGTGIPVPALQGLEALQGRLKEVDKRIEELRGKKRLSLPESGELADLTGERARLKAETEAARDLERLTEGRSEEEAGRGAAFAKSVREAGGKVALGQLELYLEQMADGKGRVGVLGAETGTAGQVARELFVNASRGNEAALASIMKVLPANNEFRQRLVEGSPETKARREAEDRFESEGHARAMADQKGRRAYQADLDAGSAAEAKESDDNFRKHLEKKLEDRVPLTAGERDAAPKEILDKEHDRFRREGEQYERLGERRNDLNARLRDLMNPQRQGMSMGLDQYEASIKSQTGDSPEVQRLNAIHKTLEAIEKNERNVKLIGVKRR